MINVKAGHQWPAFIVMILFRFYFSGLSNRITRINIQSLETGASLSKMGPVYIVYRYMYDECFNVNKMPIYSCGKSYPMQERGSLIKSKDVLWTCFVIHMGFNLQHSLSFSLWNTITKLLWNIITKPFQRRKIKQEGWDIDKRGIWKIFLLFLHENVCCGYSLEESNKYLNICFHRGIRKS